MKKYLLITALGFASIFYAQNYPYGNNYPNNNGGYENNGWYGDDQDDYYDGVDPYAYGTYDYSNANFPEDYYYDYPTDYYPYEYYQGYYNDYRNSIVGINWNNFFVEFRLSPFQIRQIVILNKRFSNYDMWYNYYGMNPDRWYYDRFYALRQILGPRIYVVFQNRYYRGYEPCSYFRNYRVTYYQPRYHVMPRYRNVNVHIYKVDRDRFFENHGDHGNHYGWNQPKNPHNGGFRTENPRVGGWNGNSTPKENGGFRGGNTGNQTWGNSGNNNGNSTPRENGGFRGGNTGSQTWGNSGNNNGNSTPRENGGFRGGNSGNSNGNSTPRENGGFRNNENKGGSERKEGGFRGSENKSEGRNSGGFGQRFTTR